MAANGASGEAFAHTEPKQMDPELVDLFPRYVANRGRDIETVTAALDRGDFELIWSIGHNMHGSGCSFGLDELSAIGAAIERAAKAADRAGILHQLLRIRDCLSGPDLAGASLRAATTGALHAATIGASSAPVAAAVSAARPAPDGAAPDVMVVDDQEMNVAIMGRFLAREGYRVRSVASGEAALAALTVPPLPALILLDVVMAGADGLETCRRIKSDPATSAIPVVLVSSADSGDDRTRVWAAGADDFLAKPVRRDELIERVRALLPPGRAGIQAEPR